MWLMSHELEDELELEKIKAQTTALATNPATQNNFLKQLFETDEEDEEEEFDERYVKWETPQTEEELEELNRFLDGM